MSKQRQPLTIRIGAVGDPPLFPDVTLSGSGNVTSVAILEQGMENGSTSVALYVTTDAGAIIFVDISAAMLLGIAAAVAGAVQRFEGGHGNN